MLSTHPTSVRKYDKSLAFQVRNINTYVYTLLSYNAPFLEQHGDFYGSGIAQWRYENVPWEPFNNTAPLKIYDTHECPRRY